MRVIPQLRSCQIQSLVYLKLDGCKKLRKLPEQIGIMEGLRTFPVSFTAIEQLSDSLVVLINLERLDLRCCELFKNLPNNVWKLKLLKSTKFEVVFKAETIA